MSKRINPNTGEKFGCADCHMGEKQVAADGTEYTSHLLISPLDNPALLASTCETAGCHADSSGKGTLAAQVDAWQKTSEDKVMSIGNKLEDLTKKLADAVAGGTLDEAKLTEVRELNRQAVWYWDFVMVENSEGSHNPQMSDKLLKLSEDATDAALKALSA
jgi:nitrite reductase (cytochrome c-552)